MFDTTRFLSCLLLSCTLAACDTDDGDTGDEMTTMNASSGEAPTTADPETTGDAGEGRCSMDMAILTCDAADCAFDPTEVDCAAACSNIASLCASNDCDAQCTGLESDPTLCTAACEGTKNLMCSNVVFGCYTSNSTCTEVGTCVDTNQ